MKKILVNKLPRIIKAKKKLEKDLEIKITNRGREVYIDGSPENEYVAEKVILAIDFGYSISNAISIKKDDLMFEIVNLKNYAKSSNIERVRGRVIGKGGKALKTLSDLTNCHLERKDNEVGIICKAEFLPNAQEAIIMLAQGAKHGNVYAHLERNQPQPLHDLGLREEE